MRYFTEELITGYATGVGWRDVNVSYTASSADNTKESSINAGTVVVLLLLALALGAAGAATLVELTTLGDRPEYKDKESAELLQEASKFRRLTQYDCVLLQRKTDAFRWALPCSFIRGGVLLNIQPRGYRSIVQREMADANIAPS